MPKVLDAYALKARYYPALLATIPALVALAILISRVKFSLTTGIASLAIPVLVFAAADVARRLGKRIENEIYAEMGGKPSVTMLRYTDNEFDVAAKEQYRAFLSSKVSQPVPTEEAENQNVKAGDAFYERAGAWLRENTRNTKKFGILFAENVTYGYRRNLLGLKWPALVTNVVLVLLCTFVQYKKGAIDADDETTIALMIVVALAVVHSLFMAFGVSRPSVVEASRTYARQLILACETFLGKEKPVAPKATPKLKAAKT
ncbi:MULTISPECIES: hypothetical protein [unclassified Beijerinckia]|uniref:hypothetical protein n=1 Tax=unclassified Beijerinckia TaxID=2638183 RepID=UPI000899B332|nr:MULTISPECIES: hypothetical protein [unclassified Beijerinckia]MDH7798157.1 hypothetical protein [Beijerinckia sp. GAS462]SED11063.1 hypothetical protein SAMN05443249_4451 [Beijerinckia sp. 28-YEA-48]